MTQMKHHGFGGPTVTQTETRSYNILGQLTRIQAGGGGGSPAVDLNYSYSPTQNNGKIQQLVNAVNGETVVYQYDSLQRLTSAVRTGGSQPFSSPYAYDGWGNLTQMGPSSYTVDPGSNRLTGLSYDANGNQLNGSVSAYDIENRLLKWDASGEEYRYSPDNRRVFKRTAATERYYFYGLNGRVASEMEVLWEADHPTSQPGMLLGPVLAGTGQRWTRYVGLRRIGDGSVGVDDHLGGGAGGRPYGEDAGRFGTHDKDSTTGLHYADQRYYQSSRGRFLTADPYRASGGVGDPGSWNRYAYTRGDPVGRNDPSGLFQLEPNQSLHPELAALLIRTWGGNEIRKVALDHLGPDGYSDGYGSFSLRQRTLAYRDQYLQGLSGLGAECVEKLQGTRMFGGRSLMEVMISNAERMNFAQYNGVEIFENFGVFSGRPGPFDTINDFVADIMERVDRASDQQNVTITPYSTTSGFGVVLLPAFYGLDLAAQRRVLVHEGLHVAYATQSDRLIADRLGLPGASEMSEADASAAIQGWLDNGCK